MKKPILLIAYVVFLCACGNNSTNTDMNNEDNKQEKSKKLNGIEGKDYMLLKRYRLMDNQGFGQPVEAASFLLPSNWNVNGGIQWTMKTCIPDMVQMSLRASSPDKSFELFVYPMTELDWSDDARILDAMRRGGVGLGCNIAEPVDASEYIRRYIAPNVQATVINTTPIESLERMMKQQAMQLESGTNYGNSGYRFNPSASEGKLQFADGKEGFALCSITQTIGSMPNMMGGYGQVRTYQTSVELSVVLKHPKGEEQTARKILSTIQSSARVNMVWGNAIATMINNIKKNIQDQTWKRIQITQQAQQEISNGITRSWESKNENSTSSNTQMWSEYLRGVDSWSDGSGNKVELTSGYSNAWSKGDGSYLLTNDPSFDPNVTFSETWVSMSK